MVYPTSGKTLTRARLRHHLTLCPASKQPFSYEFEEIVPLSQALFSLFFRPFDFRRSIDRLLLPSPQRRSADCETGEAGAGTTGPISGRAESLPGAAARVRFRAPVLSRIDLRPGAAGDECVFARLPTGNRIDLNSQGGFRVAPDPIQRTRGHPIRSCSEARPPSRVLRAPRRRAS